MSHSCPMCPTSVVRQAKSSPLILEHAIWLCLITGLLKQQWYTISFPKDWGKTLRGCWLAGRHKKKLKNKHKYLFKLIEIYISANSLLQDKKTTVTWLASDLLGQELCSGTVVSPPLWSRLEDLDNHWMDCHEIYISKVSRGWILMTMVIPRLFL